MNRGFSVVEGLVAMTLVLLSLGAMIGALAFGRHQLQISRQRVTERARLESVLTRLATLPFADSELAPGLHREAGGGQPIQWQVGLPRPGLKSIRVQLAGPRRQVQLVWLRSDSW